MCTRFFRPLASLAFLLPVSALAQKTINVPADQPTIQAGINAASSGDKVLIAPGTYYENIDFKGKSITVTASGTAAATIIDGGNTGPTVTMTSGETRASILSNLTVTHGGGNGNFSYRGIGGIYISNGAPTILNNIVTANYCQGISSYGAAPLIQGNIVSNSLTPEKCFVLQTGGIYIGGNLQSSYPAATDGTSPLIFSNTIEGNTTGQSGDGGGDGGAGIAVWGGSPVIEGNIIRNNVTRSGSGAAINVVYGGQIPIIQNLIYGNSAGCGGGAIGSEQGSLSGDVYLLIANNTIVGNSGGQNGGYSDCRKTSEVWTAFYSGGGPSLKFVNNIFDASSAPALDCGNLSGSTFDPIDEAHQSLFDHNLLYDSDGSFFASNCVDTSRLHGNLVADPQLADLPSHDFHLTSKSPAIDAGNGSVLQIFKNLTGLDLPKDFGGNTREQDATGKGQPIIDMGAYEFSGSVDATPTRIVLSSSAYTGPAGSNLVLTATLSSALGVPTGSVTFFLDDKQIGVSTISGGVATVNQVAYKPGPHVLYATYSGQGSFPAAVSVIIVVYIDKYSTSVTLTSSGNPSVAGQAVTFSITASSADGTVPSPITLTDGSATLATLTPDSSGNASYTTTLTTGYHTITASFAGDATRSYAAFSVYQQVLDPNDTDGYLTVMSNPSVYGSPVTFTAHITSAGGTAPTGSVTFAYGATVLGTATLTAQGTYATASVTSSALPVGLDNIVVTYAPTGAFHASSYYTYQQVINGYATTTTFTSTPNPSTLNQTVTFAAHVSAQASSSGTPTGSVTFTDGATTLATQPLDSNNNATISLSNLTAGRHTITATYVPTGSFAASAASLTQTVNGLASTATLNALQAVPPTYGKPISFFANVTGVSGGPAPTGTVTISVDGTAIGTSALGATGLASYQTSTLSAGPHTATCTYSGDSTYNPATCNSIMLTVAAAPSALVLNSSRLSAPALGPVTFTAVLIQNDGSAAPIANASIVFSIDGKTASTATTNSAGVATFTTPFAATAAALTTYTINATFAGDNARNATSAQLTEQVSANPTTTTLTASANPAYQNQPVTLTATIACLLPACGAQPYGVITLRDRGAVLATTTVAAGQTATTVFAFTTTSLAPGVHTLSADYAPVDANFIASFTTAQLSLTVLPQGFTLSADPASLTLQTEHHRSLAVSLTSIGGLTGRFRLACGTLPEAASCTWGTDTVLLPASGTVSTRLTLDTDVVLNFKSSVEAPGPGRAPYPLILAALLLPLLVRRPRRNVDRLLPLLLLALASCCLSACSSKYPDHTPAGTYAIPVTATPLDSPNTPPQTMNLTLVVTP